MSLTPTRHLAALLLLGALTGCDSDSSSADSDGGAHDGTTADAASDAATLDDADVTADAVAPDMGPAVDVTQPAQCNAGTVYSEGTSVFVERTNEVGLAALQVHGRGLTVGDIDGDGYADVFVRRSRNLPDVFEEDDDIKVRHAWLLRNTGNKRFEDVTVESGAVTPRGDYPIDIGRPVHVVAFGDIDNDGDMDLYAGRDTRSTPIVDWGLGLSVPETSELLFNDGTGVFTLAPEDTALRNADGPEDPSGISFVDFDRDGLLDVWQGQGGYQSILQDKLFRNVGEGQFEDATAANGLVTSDWTNNAAEAINGGRAHAMTWSTAACDLNDDGNPELLAASYGRAPNHLWLGTGDGFENRGVASGYAFDENGSPMGNEMFHCWCRGAGSAHADCQDAPAPRIGCDGVNWDHASGVMPFRNGGNSGATLCADFTGDGQLDLFTTEIKHWWAGEGSDTAELLVNTGDPDVVFERPGNSATGLEPVHMGVSWDEGNITAGHIDFDNDGRLDIYVGGTDYPGTRGLLYHNRSDADGAAFVRLPIDDYFDQTRSQGMAVADFDRDGDQDIIVGHSRMRCGGADDCRETEQIRYFENTLGQDGNWLQLDLEGTEGTNRGAVGARVTLEVDGRTLVQEVGGGYSHKGAQTDRVLHFGLGAGCVAEVTVRWPNADLTTERFTLGAGRRYHLRQGDQPRVAP